MRPIKLAGLLRGCAAATSNRQRRRHNFQRCLGAGWIFEVCQAVGRALAPAPKGGSGHSDLSSYFQNYPGTWILRGRVGGGGRVAWDSKGRAGNADYHRSSTRPLSITVGISASESLKRADKLCVTVCAPASSSSCSSSIILLAARLPASGEFEIGRRKAPSLFRDSQSCSTVDLLPLSTFDHDCESRREIDLGRSHSTTSVWRTR